MKVHSRGKNIFIEAGAIRLDLGNEPLVVIKLARELIGKALVVINNENREIPTDVLLSSLSAASGEDCLCDSEDPAKDCPVHPRPAP